MAEPQNDSIFREIEEELRHEQFAKIWKRYGNFLVGGAVAIVVAVGAFQVWKKHDLDTRRAEGERYEASLRLATGGNEQAALDAFSKLETEANDGYSLLSRFQKANLLAQQGNDEAAIDAYERISSDSGQDAIFRDLATLRSLVLRMNAGETGSSGDIKDRLQQLASDSSTWRHSAQELLAALAEQSGERARARELLSALAADVTAPQGIRQRAEELILALAE